MDSRWLVGTGGLEKGMPKRMDKGRNPRIFPSKVDHFPRGLGGLHFGIDLPSLCPRPHQHPPAPEGATMTSVWPRRISKPIRITTTTTARSPLRLHFFSRSVPAPASAFASASVTRFHSSLPSAPTSPTTHRSRPGSVTMAAPSLQAAHGLVDFVNASPTREYRQP